MTGYVKRRVFSEEGYTDTPAAWEEADKLAGKRVDRRRAYCILRDELCELATGTDECSGCYGQGCHECGYQGKRRQGMWWPHSTAESLRQEGLL